MQTRNGLFEKISVSDSIHFKGIAILLMFSHHLFALPSLINYPNQYYPIFDNFSIEYFIGAYGKVCVSIFLFTSGYGFSTISTTLSRQIHKIFSIYKTYLFYFGFIFIVGYFFFNLPKSSGELRFQLDITAIARNAIGISYDYSYEWWFFQSYIVLALLATNLIWFFKWNSSIALPLAFFCFFAGAALDIKGLDTPYISVTNVLIWQLPYSYGIFYEQHRLSICKILSKYFSDFLIFSICATSLLTGFVLVQLIIPFANNPYLMITSPLSMLTILYLIRLSNVRSGLIATLGIYTLPLWLVHPFLCYYFLQYIIFWPRYSILVYLNLLICTGLTVYALEKMRNIVEITIRRILYFLMKFSNITNL